MVAEAHSRDWRASDFLVGGEEEGGERTANVDVVELPPCWEWNVALA